MSSHPDLAGKVVVVTGAGKGIGQAIAERFGSVGSSVVVNDVDASSAEAVAAGIVDAGGSAMAAAADVSDGDAVAAMFDSVMETHGRVDVLVNNAGLVSPMLHFFDADEAWWRRIIDVNLTGHFLCCHRAARIMAKNGGGSIINMSSGAPPGPIAASRPMTPARAGSKHSLGRWRWTSGRTTSASTPSCPDRSTRQGSTPTPGPTVA